MKPYRKIWVQSNVNKIRFKNHIFIGIYREWSLGEEKTPFELDNKINQRKQSKIRTSIKDLM